MTEILTSETPVLMPLELPLGGSIRSRPLIEVRIRLEQPAKLENQEDVSEAVTRDVAPGMIQVLLSHGGPTQSEADPKEPTILGLISPHPPFKPGEERSTLFVLPEGETLRPDSRLHLRLISVHPDGAMPTGRFAILAAEARRD